MDKNNSQKLTLLRWFAHQDWIRYGIRQRVLRCFVNPDTMAPQDFEIQFHGLRYVGNFDRYLDWMAYFFGGYEKNEAQLMIDTVRDCTDAVFIDIGANIGQYTLVMAQHCSQVHAFEPYPPVYQQLEQHIRNNDIQNICLHRLALGAEDGQMEFYVANGRNDGTNSFVRGKAFGNKPAGKYRVYNGDDYCATLNFERINLIKMDVEGYEKAVLTGLQQTLRKFRPAVFMEFSYDTWKSFADENDLFALFPKDYSVQRIIGYRPWFIFNLPYYGKKEFNFNIGIGIEVNLLFSPHH